MEAIRERSERVVVRRLRPDDLARVIALDAKIVGRERSKFFETTLQRNLRESGIQVSLAAEVDGLFAGYLLARTWYGEFGTLEPYAVLEAFGVHPDQRQQGVGRAMLEQLVTNLNALGLRLLRTEVDWRDLELISFFHHAGFQPAQRLCLDLQWSASDPRGENRAR
jgi:ribosomal protein S18 acetylase RimI-like enzyme